MDIGHLEQILMRMERFGVVKLTLTDGVVIERAIIVKGDEDAPPKITDEQRRILMENDLFAASGIVPKPFGGNSGD